MPSGCGRKCRLLALLIGIAIGSSDERAVAMMNVGDHALRSGDVEDATRPHGHFAHSGSLLRATCHYSAHEVTCLEALDTFVLLGSCTREPVLVHATHLSAAMPSRGDVQWNNVFDDERGWRAPAYVGCIEPVGLVEPPHHAVVLSEAATSTFPGGPQNLKPRVEGPARGVDT